MNLVHRRHGYPQNFPQGGVDDFFNAFFQAPLAPSANRWSPAVDVVETDNDYRFVVELPGVAKEDVKIEFSDGVLTLRGEKKSAEKKDGEAWRRVERRYGAFERSFELPVPVKGEAIRARYADGMLTVSVPKADEVRPHEISID